MADVVHFPPAPEGWERAEIALGADNRLVLRAEDGAELVLDETGMAWCRPAQEGTRCGQPSP